MIIENLFYVSKKTSSLLLRLGYSNYLFIIVQCLFSATKLHIQSSFVAKTKRILLIMNYSQKLLTIGTSNKVVFFVHSFSLDIRISYFRMIIELT